MKRTDTIILCVALLAFAGMVYYSYALYKRPVTVEDPKTAEYLRIEVKRNQVLPAINHIKAGRYEEAQIFLLTLDPATNPFVPYLRGRILYKTGKRMEGLELIKQAIQQANILYDTGYFNNIRGEMGEMMVEILSIDELRQYRHFLESKLKGGCG